MSQARITESLGPTEKILHLRLTMLWLRAHPHLTWELPIPLPTYWMGITCFCPSHGLAQVLRSPEKEKHALSASRFHLGPTMLPFVFSFPNFQ
jgi:hypothetical protein